MFLSLPPSALCGSPVFGQRVSQVHLCHLYNPSTGMHWSLRAPLVYAFRLNWLTHKTRCVRVSVPRRALPRFKGFTMAFLSQATTS